MQRLKFLAAAGIVGLILMFFGAKFVWREYHLSKPSRMWVPISLRADLPLAEQEKLAEQIDKSIRTDAILRQVVTDMGLQVKFGQSTEDAAVKELDRRLFVEAGTADTPTGPVPSINIGLNGTGHESVMLGEASTRIVKDVWRLIGIDPETGKPLNQPAPDSSGAF